MCEIISYRKRIADYFNKRLTVLGQKQWEASWTLSARHNDANFWRTLWTLSARSFLYNGSPLSRVNWTVFVFLSISISLFLSSTRDCTGSPLSNPSLFLSFFTKLKHYKPFVSSLGPFNRFKSFSFFKFWKISSWNPRTNRTSFVHFDPNFFLFQPHFHPQSLSHLSNFVSTNFFSSQLIYGGTTPKACSNQAHCSATF